MFRSEHARAAIAAEVRAAMARHQPRITATDISAATGIPASTLSRKVNGHQGFTVDELLKVARALGVDAGALIATATESAGAA